MRAPRIAPWLLVATLTAAGAAAAAGYGVTAPDRYRATAQIVVSPVSAADPTFAGLDVLGDAAGRPRAAQTAAVLVRSPQVADAVRAQLGLRRSSGALLDELDVHPVDGSDVVDVTAEDTSAATAAQLANAFVDAVVAQRTAIFQSRLGAAVHRDEQLLAAAPSGAQAAELARRLAALRSLQGQPDPTLRRASTAATPASSSWPDLPVLILVGAGIGLGAALLVLLATAVARRRGAGLLPEYDRPAAARRPDGPGGEAVDALVDRLEQRLAARESALAARERDLQAKIDELRALERRRPAGGPAGHSAAREDELAERERQLEERVAAVTKRELELARRGAALAARERGRESAPAAPRPGAQEPAGFDLRELERLVAERGGRFPERREEWQSYLFFLRDYAGPDGALPGSFDWLVQDTFRELLA